MTVHIAGWLLWFVAGVIVGAVAMRFWFAAYERAAIGRMFGW